MCIRDRGAPGLWQPDLAPEDAEQLTQRDAKTLAVRLQSAPGLLTELFRARGWLGDPNGEGVNVRFPRHHEHSGGAPEPWAPSDTCLLYTSDAADERSSV